MQRTFPTCLDSFCERPGVGRVPTRHAKCVRHLTVFELNAT
jgi:hypothetical protein